MAIENSTDVTVESNQFTPLSSATAFTHILFDTFDGNPSGVAPGAGNTTVFASLVGNTFNSSDVAGNHGVALLFLNGNPYSDYGYVDVGGSTFADQNIFNATETSGFENFVRLDPGTVKANVPANVVYGPAQLSIDLSSNRFTTNDGMLKTPSNMSLAELYDLEDKLFHAVDYPGVGFLSVVPSSSFVTPASVFSAVTYFTNSSDFLADPGFTPDALATSAKIQRGIDDPALPQFHGDVFVKAGTYFGKVSIDKSINLRGAQEGVDALARYTTPVAESIIDGTGETADALVSVEFFGVEAMVDGFVIQNSPRAAIGISAPSTIQNNDIRGTPGFDGVIVSDDFATITKNLFNKAPGNGSTLGVTMDPFVEFTEISANDFSNCSDTVISFTGINGRR